MSRYQITTVAESISELEVPGLTIKGLDNIPPDCTKLIPIMYPEPLNFVSNFTSVRDTFGTSETANKTVEYDLNYSYLFCQVSAGRTGLDYYDEMIEIFEAIIDEILDNDDIAGAVDLSVQGVANFGPLPDPAGNMYLGTQLVLHIVEYL